MTITLQKQVDLNAESILTLNLSELREATLTLIDIVEGLTAHYESTGETVSDSSQPSRGGKPVGAKIGKTSKFHYVFWSSRSKKWISQIRRGMKNFNVYRGPSEIEAAKAVDVFLDEIGDTKRPRNRDEFPEVRQ